MMQRWGFKGIAGLVVMGLASASCGTILGIDKDYHPFVDEDGGGGSGSTGSAAADGEVCAAGSDCRSGVCTNQICQATCADGLKNGNETDVDCGGTNCSPCTTCSSYCGTIIANCTGDNTQYEDDAICQAVCESFPPGDVGAMAGNSLACRAYHADAAMATGKPEVHCGHSGLTGGDLDPTAIGGMADGPCGNGVEAFCKLAVATCKGETGAYEDEAACKAEAKQFPKSTTPFSATKDKTGNTFNCRAYHLTAATADAATHCAHIKLDSVVCK